MSGFTWWAEPAEIPVANATILVGAGEAEGVGERVAMVIHSEHLDISTWLTAAQASALASALSGAASTDELWPPYGEREPEGGAS